MKRLFAALLLVVGIGTALVAPATAGDTQGPPCSDIKLVLTDATFTSNGDGTSTLAGVVVSTDVAPCSFVTYTLYVNGDAFDVIPNTSLTYTVTGDTVTLVAESSIHRHVADRAPNAGSVTLVADEAPAGYEFD